MYGTPVEVIERQGAASLSIVVCMGPPSIIGARPSSRTNCSMVHRAEAKPPRLICRKTSHLVDAEGLGKDAHELDLQSRSRRAQIASRAGSRRSATRLESVEGAIGGTLQIGS